MVDHAAPAGTVTEAFAWLETAVAVGASVGAASAGAVAEAAGPGRGLRRWPAPPAPSPPSSPRCARGPWTSPGYPTAAPAAA